MIGFMNENACVCDSTVACVCNSETPVCVTQLSPVWMTLRPWVWDSAGLRYRHIFHMFHDVGQNAMSEQIIALMYLLAFLYACGGHLTEIRFKIRKLWKRMEGPRNCSASYRSSWKENMSFRSLQRVPRVDSTVDVLWIFDMYILWGYL